MNVGAPSAVNGALSGSAGVAATADARSVLTQIAQAPGLNEGERTALVQITATASSIANSELRAVALRQISTTGLYFSRTGDSGLPRWSVMTALRAYGLNLQAAPRAQTPEQNAAAAQDVAQQLAALAQTRSVSLPEVLRAAPVQQQAAAPTPVQAKNAAVVNLGGLPSSKGSNDPADLTTQILNQLV